MKRFILLLFIVVLITGCGYVGEIKTDNKSLSVVTKKSEPVISAIEKYREDKGIYPSELKDLIPNYIESELDLPYDFEYSKGVEPSIITDNETVDYGGYELKVHNLRGFYVLGDRSFKYFVYRPSKKYPERKWIKPIKRVNDWALIEKFRRYGDNENPIIGKGV